MSCSPDPRENLAKAESQIREAAARGAQIVCLQELFRSQYFCREERAELFELAEPIPGPSTAALGKLARELKVVVVASLFERRAAGLYHNTAAVLNTEGEIEGLYRKMHIPDDPLYFEKFYFTPGDLGFRSFDTPFGRIGVLVCWDQWYPEGARITSLAGADILFYPTAIGWHPSEKAQYGAAQLDAWRTIQRSHAIANGVYVAAVNRVGYEGGVTEIARTTEPGGPVRAPEEIARPIQASTAEPGGPVRAPEEIARPIQASTAEPGGPVRAPKEIARPIQASTAEPGGPVRAPEEIARPIQASTAEPGGPVRAPEQGWSSGDRRSLPTRSAR